MGCGKKRGITIGMQPQMASTTKPSNLQRLRVILVVHLGCRASALLAGCPCNLAAPKSEARVAASVLAPLRIGREFAILRARGPHIGGMTRSAISLTHPIARITASRARSQFFRKMRISVALHGGIPLREIVSVTLGSRGTFQATSATAVFWRYGFAFSAYWSTKLSARWA